MFPVPRDGGRWKRGNQNPIEIWKGKHMSKQRRAAPVPQSKAGGWLFSSEFMDESGRLFGPPSSGVFFTFTMLLCATKWGKVSVNSRSFNSKAPILRNGNLVKRIVEMGLAAESRGRLRLLDNEQVRERREFCKRSLEDFSTNLKARSPGLWKLLQGSHSR